MTEVEALLRPADVAVDGSQKRSRLWTELLHSGDRDLWRLVPAAGRLSARCSRRCSRRTIPTAQSLADRLQPPMFFGGNVHHIFGTDQLGRDLLSRMFDGARVTDAGRDRRGR